MTLIDKIKEFFDSPFWHKHDTTELSDTLKHFSEFEFIYVKVIHKWWCPICKRGWTLESFASNQDRQIFNHIQKLKIQKLKDDVRRQAGVLAEFDQRISEQKAAVEKALKEMENDKL